jgi:hypothetical protein
MFVSTQIDKREASLAGTVWAGLTGISLYVIPYYGTGSIGIRYDIYKDLVVVKQYQYEANKQKVGWIGLGLPYLLHGMPEWTLGSGIQGTMQRGAEDRFAEAVGMTFTLFLADAQRDGFLDEQLGVGVHALRLWLNLSARTENLRGTTVGAGVEADQEMSDHDFPWDSHDTTSSNHPSLPE